RVVSIERGRDPRDLTLVAFGGSGPVHGCRLAQALGIPRVILPAAAGVTAAIGLLAAEVKFDVARTYVRRLDGLDPAAVDAMYGEMAAQATEVVRESAVAGEVALVRSADARYVGQGYELTVPVPGGRLDDRAPAGPHRGGRRVRQPDRGDGPSMTGRAAKTLGVTFPPPLLARADEVVQ